MNIDHIDRPTRLVQLLFRAHIKKYQMVSGDSQAPSSAGKFYSLVA